MTAPEPNYICNNCGRVIPAFERVLHELNCRASQNNAVNFILKIIDPKKNVPLKTTGNINNINNNFISFTCNICGAKINLNEREEHSLYHNLPNSENTLRINNLTCINNYTIINNDNQNSTSRNEEALNIDGIKIAQNIQANGVHQQIPEEDQNNEYYYYNQNAQDNENNFNNALDENGYSDDIISLSNVLINDHNNNNNNHVDTKIVENLITNEIKDINKFAVKTCSICLENFQNGDYYIILPCIHFFHANCLKNWMNMNNRCPICNFKLIVNNIITTKNCNKKI